jgi:hypothetical protein
MAQRLGTPLHISRQLPSEGKSSEGDHNGQENFEEGEEDGSDEVVDGEAAEYQALVAIFSLDSGKEPSPAGLKSSEFRELLPIEAAALFCFSGRCRGVP